MCIPFISPTTFSASSRVPNCTKAYLLLLDPDMVDKKMSLILPKGLWRLKHPPQTFLVHRRIDVVNKNREQAISVIISAVVTLLIVTFSLRPMIQAFVSMNLTISLSKMLSLILSHHCLSRFGIVVCAYLKIK